MVDLELVADLADDVVRAMRERGVERHTAITSTLDQRGFRSKEKQAKWPSYYAAINRGVPAAIERFTEAEQRRVDFEQVRREHLAETDPDKLLSGPEWNAKERRDELLPEDW